METLDQPKTIEATGTPEAVWRDSQTLRAISQRPLDTLLRPTQRLVVVAPHPDDEILASGGLLALHTARTGPCLVVAVTDGEASHPPSPGRNAQQLGALRADESREGLQALGLAPDPATWLRLQLPDSAVADQAHVLAAALRPILTRADLVVTTWRLDGHPDHEACGRAVAQACHIVGCALLEAPVWMWHWSHPGDARVPWSRLIGVPLPAEVVARKHRALAAHRSQLHPAQPGEAPILGDTMASRVARPAEYFFA